MGSSRSTMPGSVMAVFTSCGCSAWQSFLPTIHRLSIEMSAECLHGHGTAGGVPVVADVAWWPDGILFVVYEQPPIGAAAQSPHNPLGSLLRFGAGDLLLYGPSGELCVDRDHLGRNENRNRDENARRRRERCCPAPAPPKEGCAETNQPYDRGRYQYEHPEDHRRRRQKAVVSIDENQRSHAQRPNQQSRGYGG